MLIWGFCQELLDVKNALKECVFGCFGYKVSPTPWLLFLRQLLLLKHVNQSGSLCSLLLSPYQVYLLFLHLRILLDLQSSPTVLPSLLSHAVETWSSPFKNSISKTLRWRWAESNRRPTCLHIEGITTIL